MKTPNNAFKSLEGDEKVPRSRRNEVITTVLTVQFFSDIVSLFTFQMAQTFSGMLSGNPEQKNVPQTADLDWDDNDTEMPA